MIRSIFSLSMVVGILILLLETAACKTREESLPLIKFRLSADKIYEGDTVTFINESEFASSFVWKIESLKYSDKAIQPSYVFTQAGKYELTLLGKNGDGKTAEQKLELNVLPDTVYRLSKNSSKVWIVKSIVYSGSEVLTETCQKDDEFTVYYGKRDTCTLREGSLTCSPGTYFFDLPATSDWRVNPNNNNFEFGLTAFGSQINLSFVTTEILSNSYKGTDALNEVSIHLVAK